MGLFVPAVRAIVVDLERIASALDTNPNDARLLADWGLSAPVDGEPGWRTWDVQQLSADQCREAAWEARKEACWHYAKSGMLIVAAGVIVVALCAISVLAMDGLFSVLEPVLQPGGAFDIYADYLLKISGANVVTFGLAIFAIALSAFSIVMAVEFSAFMLVFKVAGIAATIWQLEVVPAVERSTNYADHLFTEASALSRQADLLAFQPAPG